MGKAKANAGLLARRPDNLAFKHQRLPVWSPMLTAHTILPSFYCMATIRVKLGVCLLATVQNTHELKVDYTHAGSCDKCFETTSWRLPSPTSRSSTGSRAREPFTEGLPTGNYCIHISYTSFSLGGSETGRKEVVLSTVSWFGSQNNFLPVAYLITGCLILLLTVILTAIWWKFGKNRRNMEE
ncbi:unnamed protein product [Oncorhynchus mykiss]|uniref:Uncharacterized protein n=1 Tax=Oncorhynchus mykiss TaxID=8022 RepID=A0A060XMG0_ONCMY|nr:unnamed protein product [Oncorhynchus mykiss]